MAKMALLIAASLALAACGMTKPLLFMGDLPTLANEAADDYSTNLRWGRMAQAAALVEPMRRSEFLSFFEDGHRYRFTDAEVDALDYDEATLSAQAKVRFTLYAIPMVREIKVVDTQEWRFDRKTESWYVDPNLEVFRRVR
jgi:hypothetical protein